MEENKDKKGGSHLLDEISEEFDKETDFDDYTQNTQFYSNNPDNQFSHAWQLINTQRKQMHKDGFDFLFDPQILLGNIDNEKSLRLYQIDLFFLNNMFSCALNDPVMEHVFKPLWSNFKNEVRITSVIGGGERFLQAFHIPAQQQSKGFKLLGKRKKKKEPVNYVIPEEDDGIY
jgi:hypothetical protein